MPGPWGYGYWGGYIIYGRSDSTLNPGGVRIGTSEIYRQVESFDEVAEALVVGQNFENDVRIILFIKLKNKLTLSDNLIQSLWLNANDTNL